MHCQLSLTVGLCTPCQKSKVGLCNRFFSWGHDPFTLACKARPSFDGCGTFLSVSLSLSLSSHDVPSFGSSGCSVPFRTLDYTPSMLSECVLSSDWHFVLAAFGLMLSSIPFSHSLDSDHWCVVRCWYFHKAVFSGTEQRLRYRLDKVGLLSYLSDLIGLELFVVDGSHDGTCSVSVQLLWHAAERSSQLEAEKTAADSGQ